MTIINSMSVKPFWMDLRMQTPDRAVSRWLCSVRAKFD
jgi:hypothetical protein